MSIVQRTHLIRLRFRDNDLTESTCEANLSYSVAESTALTFLASWRSIVSALSSAVCIEADLLVRWTETNSSGAGSQSDSFRHGVFIIETAVPDLAVIRVPSIDLSLLETTGPFAGIRIDQSNTDVIAFIDALCNGIGGIQPCDPFGNDLVQISQAYKEQS